MQREWFIRIKSEEYGPYSIEELKYRVRVTPDTLVRKKEWKEWLKVKEVAELQWIFEEEENEKPRPHKKNLGQSAPLGDVLTASLDPKNMFWWFLIGFIALIYSYLRLFG